MDAVSWSSTMIRAALPHFTLTIISTILLSSCTDMGVNEVTVPLTLRGTEVARPLQTFNEATLSLSKASLAFGPLYICAGVNAGDLCETARLEWLDSVVINLISDEELKAGELSGITGTVQSWMYDLGISSQLTRKDPFVLNAADRLNGHSLEVIGEANVGEVTIPFSAQVAVQQSDATELGIPVVRKSGSDPFFYELKSSETELLITFDLSTWFKQVDFNQYLSAERCEEEAAETVCDGQIELSCDGDLELERRDCTSIGQVCLSRIGCRDQLVIEEGSSAYRALRGALLAGERPIFTWRDETSPSP